MRDPLLVPRAPRRADLSCGGGRNWGRSGKNVAVRVTLPPQRERGVSFTWEDLKARPLSPLGDLKTPHPLSPSHPPTPGGATKAPPWTQKADWSRRSNFRSRDSFRDRETRIHKIPCNNKQSRTLFQVIAS